MKYLLLILLSGCSLEVNEGTIDKVVPANVYVIPSPYLEQYDQVVVANSADRLPGTIHIEKGSGVRYRQILNTNIYFKQGRVTIGDDYDRLVMFNEVNLDIRRVVIEDIQYPLIVLSGQVFDYSDFIRDYKYYPNYNVGDTLYVITKDQKLEAIR